MVSASGKASVKELELKLPSRRPPVARAASVILGSPPPSGEQGEADDFEAIDIDASRRAVGSRHGRKGQEGRGECDTNFARLRASWP